MLPPLLRTLAAEPELWIEHAGGYLQLAGVEANEFAEQMQRRALRLLSVALLALLGLTLAGVALLLCAVIPAAQWQLPWLLWAVPTPPLLLALLLALRLIREPRTTAFALLRHQLQADHQLLATQSPR